jgi:hypothetical protein
VCLFIFFRCVQNGKREIQNKNRFCQQVIQMRCDECKGQIKKKKVDYSLLGVHLGRFNAMVCSSCDEMIFEGDTFQAIEKAAKAKGVWGIAAKTRIGTSGNALDVKIPKAIAEFLELQKGQEVVIEPINKKSFQVIIG